jgi:MinD-like ATPase involved in chromosome partitioning or flagellar assembly
MLSAPQKIAFVSGKGGVGKTLLAANFAFCSSTNQRTILIDFDFQNQGSSGLLAQYLTEGCPNAFDLLMTEKPKTTNLIEIRKDLLFIPAFDPGKANRFGSQISASFSVLNVNKLSGMLNTLMADNDAQSVVVDCHGGLDDVSFSAFISADVTFIVTEADRVTFNGTLELLDFYLERAAATHHLGCTKTEAPSKNDPALARKFSHVEENKVSILVNRVSGRFSYDALQHVCARQFYENVHALREMNTGFFFFPIDPLAAESFSEYPFYVELMPESILAQKMELLYTKTTNRSPIIAGRSRFYRIFERKSPGKLNRYLKSPSEARMQGVFSFAMTAQLVFFILGVAGYVTYTVYEDPKQAEQYFAILFLLVTSVVLLFSARIDVQISGFFRDRLRYELRLYRRGGRQLSIPFLVRLTRVWLFRSFAVAAATTFVCLALVFGAAAIGMYIEPPAATSPT